MKPLSHTETPSLQTLLSWIEDLIGRITASTKPKHRAGQIAAVVAEGGNPSGA
jgi:hypothetical protein